MLDGVCWQALVSSGHAGGMSHRTDWRCDLISGWAYLRAQIPQVFMRPLLGAAHVILSELSQFPDIVDFCETMANSGKTVIVAALDGTFQRKVKMSDPGLAEGPEGGDSIQGLPRSRCVQNKSYWLVGALNWPGGREQEGAALKKSGISKV